jgi:sec-independent protein translocase protein TatA
MIPALPQVGGTELLILLVIILLLFGAKRIPQLARSLGTGTREFRKGISGAYDDVKAVGDDETNNGEEAAPSAEHSAKVEQKL